MEHPVRRRHAFAIDAPARDGLSPVRTPRLFRQRTVSAATFARSHAGARRASAS